MVRIKHRYLLLNILYPEQTPSKPASTSTSAPSSSIEPDYLKFHGPTPQYVTSGLFITYLRSQITALFGDYGLGVTQGNLKLVYFSNATSTAILRVARAHFRLLWAVLTYIGELPPSKGQSHGAQCVIRVVRVSGTIRKAEEELMRRSRREVVRAKLAQQGHDGVALRRLIGAVNPVPRTSNEEADADMDGLDMTSESE